MTLAPGGARAKGSAGELEAARLLVSWAQQIGVELELARNLEQVRSGGADINGVPGLEVEVKRQEKLDVNGWWRQVCRAADRTGKLPFLMYRQNRRPWNFRARCHLAVYGPSGSGVIQCDVNLDIEAAKKWFQMHVWYQTKGDVK